LFHIPYIIIYACLWRILLHLLPLSLPLSSFSVSASQTAFRGAKHRCGNLLRKRRLRIERKKGGCRILLGWRPAQRVFRGSCLHADKQRDRSQGCTHFFAARQGGRWRTSMHKQRHSVWPNGLTNKRRRRRRQVTPAAGKHATLRCAA
jgi:hypothetical protein